MSRTIQTRQTSRLLPASVVFLVALLSAAPLSAKLYSWTDEQGNIHYSDKVPPDQAKHARKELSETGVTVKKLDAAKTPAQLAEEERLKRIEREKQQEIAKRIAHDRVLLDTFNSSDDMVMTRDGKIQAIEAIIGLTESAIENARKNLQSLRRKAANLEKSGKKVPDNLGIDIAQTQQHIDENLAFIETKRAEQQQIHKTFEADIHRFNELKAMLDKQEAEFARKQATQY